MNSMRKMKKSSGFTIIELVIVVAIIGIISTIALSWYGGNVIASKRTEARAALQAFAGRLEKCKSLYGTYNNANCNFAGFTTEAGLYDITAAFNANGTNFTLTAAPVVGESQAEDDDCTGFTLTHTGVKGATGANTDDCW